MGFYREVLMLFGLSVVVHFKRWAADNDRLARAVNNRILLLRCRRSGVFPKHIVNEVKCVHSLFQDRHPFGHKVFSVAIYAMATILLCSRIFIPEHVLLHGAIALFLSIVTLSIIHRGFNAVAHDCPFHLYWFAVILIVLLLIQFLFEMFGIRETSRQVWYKEQSLPIEDPPSSKVDLRESIENFVIEDPNKMEYRVPTNDELEARKRQLYGKTHEEHDAEKKRKSVWTKPGTFEEEKEIELPMYHVRRRPPYRRRNNYDIRRRKYGSDDLFKRRVNFRNPKLPANETEEKLTNTPLVLVFHGYSFILKMLCVALSVLTGFMYQLEYI